MAGMTFATRTPRVPLLAREVADVRPVGRAHRPGRRPAAWAGGLRAGVPIVGPVTGSSTGPFSAGWSWRGSLLLAAVLLHPYLLVLALPATGAERLHTAAAMCRLLAAGGILAAAVILKCEWRMSRWPSTGWLTLLLAYLGAQSLPFALLAVQGTDPGRFSYVVGVAQLPGSLVVLLLAVLASRGTHLPVSSPLTTGLVVGGIAGATRLTLIDLGLDPSLRLSAATHAAVTGVVAAVVGTAVVVLVRSTVLPGWIRIRVAAFLTFLVAGEVLATGQPGQPRTVLSVAAVVAGVGLLVSTAAVVLRQGVTENSRTLADLAHRAATAEVDVRHGRERMHELHATVAGIAQASRLLVQDVGPARSQRRRLETLLDSEMARLERMLSRRAQQPVAAVCLDEVLRPLVEAQVALGADVRLVPSGLRALGRSDDLAEVVHILLSNAARHAPGSPVTVSAAAHDGRVEVRVCDEGPGVPTALLPTLFTWGGRRTGSPGQGIGLQLAKRLMLEQAGNLTLEDGGRPGGAAFVLTVPSCPPGMP